jgi:hypothetical protein
MACFAASTFCWISGAISGGGTGGGVGLIVAVRGAPSSRSGSRYWTTFFPAAFFAQ